MNTHALIQKRRIFVCLILNSRILVKLQCFSPQLTRVWIIWEKKTVARLTEFAKHVGRWCFPLYYNLDKIDSEIKFAVFNATMSTDF